jgi:hypothetical protein
MTECSLPIKELLRKDFSPVVANTKVTIHMQGKPS